MQTVFRTMAGHLRRLTHDGSALVSLLIVTALLAVMLLTLFALWPALTPPGAASPPPPPMSLSGERAEEQRWLAERHADAYNAVIAARDRQEESKEQWLARRGLTGGAP